MIYSFFFLSFFFGKKGSMLMCSLGVGCWDSSDAWD